MQAEKQRLVELNGGGSGETNFAFWVKVSPRRGNTWALEPASRSVYVIGISHGIKNLMCTDCFLLAGLCSSWHSDCV